jgi:hypothetical protein
VTLISQSVWDRQMITDIDQAFIFSRRNQKSGDTCEISHLQIEAAGSHVLETLWTTQSHGVS